MSVSAIPLGLLYPAGVRKDGEALDSQRLAPSGVF